MASLSLEGRPDKEGFFQSISGGNRYLLDYLTEEILSHQSQAVQDFLLQTSILERLCPALCAALIDQACIDPGKEELEHYQGFLDILDRSNLFLSALDSQHTWYRYHRLFADLLKTRLQTAYPALVPELHRRAAHWFAAHQFPLEAFQHASAIGDLEFATDLVSHNLQELIQRAEVATLTSWLATFPPQYLLERVELCLAKGWVNLYHIHFAEVEKWAQRANALLQPDVSSQD
ncbi:MAG: LuxR family transcriptional regulator, partial [Anaerolineaceae bacterium]|nr:LuxR family transcriptional regulator [Anaerolineaceae bacterium]